MPYICITRTVHRTVISVEHLAIASAGFFVLLANFNTQNYIYPFQNLSLGFILKIFLKFRKFQPRYFYKIYSYKTKIVFYLESDHFEVLHICRK